MTINATSLVANTARGGGGGAGMRGSRLTVRSAAMLGNAAGEQGGGVLCEARAQVAVANATRLEGNTAPLGGGASIGGVSDSVCLWEAEALTCASNAATPSPLLPHGGGCAFLSARSTAAIIESQLLANSAAMGGGLLVLGTMTLNQSSLESNVATHGGGLMLQGDAARVEASSVHIDANVASGCGGGASVLGGSLHFVGRGSRLANNSAADAGGAVFFEAATAAALAAEDDVNNVPLTQAAEDDYDVNVSAGAVLGGLPNSTSGLDGPDVVTNATATADAVSSDAQAANSTLATSGNRAARGGVAFVNGDASDAAYLGAAVENCDTSNVASQYGPCKATLPLHMVWDGMETMVTTTTTELPALNSSDASGGTVAGAEGDIGDVVSGHALPGRLTLRDGYGQLASVTGASMRVQLVAATPPPPLASAKGNGENSDGDDDGDDDHTVTLHGPLMADVVSEGQLGVLSLDAYAATANVTDALPLVVSFAAAAVENSAEAGGSVRGGAASWSLTKQLSLRLQACPVAEGTGGDGALDAVHVPRALPAQARPAWGWARATRATLASSATASRRARLATGSAAPSAGSSACTPCAAGSTASMRARRRAHCAHRAASHRVTGWAAARRVPRASTRR